MPHKRDKDTLSAQLTNATCGTATTTVPHVFFLQENGFA